MPYIVFQDETEISGFYGLSLAVGWLSDCKMFQITFTIGTYTVSVGLDFGY